MAWVQRGHRGILLASLLLTGFGLVAVYSASAVVALERHQDAYFFVRRHALSAALGVGAMLLIMPLDYRLLQKWAWWGVLATLLLLVLVYVPTFAREAGGARRWLQLGRLSFQPAEVAKLTLLLYLAQRLGRVRRWQGGFTEHYLPVAMVAGSYGLLTLLQPDLGTAVLLGGLALLMLFIAGAPLRYLVGSSLAALPLLYAVVVHVGFRWRRLLAFWDPWAMRADAGFQVVQSLLAFGRGGLLGVGPGAGKQKLFFLPEAHTDFVFAVIGEEFGFVGCVVVLALFGVLLWSGMAVAWRSDDLFGRYLASGITCMILLQAVMNVAVVVGYLPTKGLPLPFVSLGGSSLLVTLVAIGILLGISARLPDDTATAAVSAARP
jgi:cell division protein FtsW